MLTLRIKIKLFMFQQIKTTAIGEDTEDHIEKAKEDAVIVDTVEYKGLEVGREYVMTGKLVDKVTGEVITDAEGNEITASETFIAEEKDGSIDITFKFDSSALAGKSLVAFESLTTEGKEVAVHADLTDEGPDRPYTGNSYNRNRQGNGRS